MNIQLTPGTARPYLDLLVSERAGLFKEREEIQGKIDDLDKTIKAITEYLKAPVLPAPSSVLPPPPPVIQVPEYKVLGVDKGKIKAGRKKGRGKNHFPERKGLYQMIFNILKDSKELLTSAQVAEQIEKIMPSASKKEATSLASSVSAACYILFKKGDKEGRFLERTQSDSGKYVYDIKRK